ncbi:MULTISPECIES: response regulator transcription factor [Olivibacter]|jgi:DNA-binding NarL/FixJ family response regulator|uniref:Two component transcriptional regulator, LuxR family n=3 Tax=Sphingobacteriaceae TaxID=84566 RepID=F4C4B8_SPHS2|nr:MULTISPECIES: response regulator transcription factor [Olivibacter]MCL4638205.1 response regulator transcription factor [Olivibacter sp. UJ_SKK_5.1]MDM8175485.1 response regulator transcription factor [Olivibacter sp. 47]MDX3914096.1 response regulator transcription factor [Pseudosphingobacterium sp.]QEL02241.1 response regulator transcription factor [Olivibacter sp. LS-1]
MSKITVLLADDHILVRNGIKAMLEADDDIMVIGEADNGMQAIQRVQELQPDLAIMDIRMPEMNGLEACEAITQNKENTKVVMLSMHDTEDYVLESLRVGAWGYLLKDTDKNEFIKALKQINNGIRYYSGSVSNVLANQLLGGAGSSSIRVNEAVESNTDIYGLSKREKQILGMVINGKHNKDIAEVLGKSVRTIETHRFNIMKKLGVNNAVDMINKAMKENLI